MKKALFLLLSLILIQINIFSQAQTQTQTQNAVVPEFYTAANQPRNTFVFSEKNLFGLKDKDGNIVAPAKYQKLVMTGKQGWIAQKKNKYGLMNSNGEWLIKPKFRNADRILGRYIKLGNDDDYGIYNEFGETIIPPEYTSIELLYGKMFLTYKNFRYGILDFKGNVLIPNICDDIYMPEKDTLKIKYLGEWYELKEVKPNELIVPTFNDAHLFSNLDFKEIIVDTGAISGYSVLTFSDYIIKIFSSISPAHEETIDQLIFVHGVDTVGILKNFSWLPKYPVTFIKNYYNYYVNPFTGPLSDTRNKLKTKGGK